jgi:hypothetical protein
MKPSSAQHPRWSRWLAAAFALPCLALVPTASAQSVNSVTLPLTNGYIYDADEFDSDALTNRHLVSGSASITLPAGGTYRVLFDILNQRNFSVGSATSPISTYTPNVAFNVSGSINPSSRILPHADHTLQARLQRLNGTNWVTLDTSTSVPRRYWHFTNTVNVDGPVNVIPSVDSGSYARTWILDSMPSARALPVPVNYTIRRYDAFASPPVDFGINVRVSYELRDDLDNLIHSGTQDATIPCPSRSTQTISGIPFPVASETTGTITLAINPPSQLSSASRLYSVTASISHIESGGTYTPANSLTLPNQRLLHYNGTLTCGPISTSFNSITNNPTPSTVAVPYVSASLAIAQGAGFLAQGYTFGPPTGLSSFRLHDDGHAELVIGTIAVNGPIPDTDAIGNVSFTRLPITLSPGGASASIVAALPAGVGYSSSASAPMLDSGVAFTNVALSQNLDPTAATLTNSSAVFVSEETKPVRIAVSQITWTPAASRFDLTTTGASAVRKPLLDVLNAATVNNAAMKKKRSNDHWWNGLDGTATAVSIKATASNGGQLSASFGLASGNAFTTHLPYDVNLSPQSASSVAVTDDLIAPSSTLAGVQSTSIRYEQTCDEPDNCAGGTSYSNQPLAFTTSNLTITPDGGLHGAVTISTGGLLSWGFVDTISRNAQNVDTPFQTGNFYASGHFIRGSDNNLTPDQAPSVISLQGRVPSALATTEKPGTAAYDAGLADYPGLNYRVSEGQQGLSYLCGIPVGFGPFNLKTRSKYYARYSGVSGIHDAVNGTFPSNATLFGYNFSFSNYGLSFLSNLNVISRTNGAIVLPAPSNFQLPMEKISFTCRGSIKEAKVPGSATSGELDYWNVDFRPLAIRFLADNACNPADSRLVIAMETSAAHLNEPLFGKVGFHPNGQIIRPSDNYANITSEFALPGKFSFNGPGSEKYEIVGVRGAYLNHAASHPAGPGFWNVAASVNVPFFEDLKTHVHFSGDADATSSPVYIMGGWAKSGSGTPTRGWATGPNGFANFFTSEAFDLAHDGFPTAVGLPTYRNLSEANAPHDESYLCRAQQSWLDAVNFDYPLDWSSSGRSFTGHRVHKNDLFVLNVEHQVEWLTGENAKISFGAQYDGLPKIHVANFFNKHADQALKDIESFVTATSDDVFNKFTGGVDDLAEMLNDQVDGLVDGVLDKGIDQFHDAFCQAIQNALNQANPNACQQVINQYIRNGPLKNALNNIASAANQPSSILNAIDQRLISADQSIAAITGQLANGNAFPNSMLGDLDQAGNNINAFVMALISQHLGNVAQNVGVDSIAKPIQDLVNGAKPQLNQLVNQLKSIQQTIKQVRNELAQTGAIVQQIQQIVQNATSQINAVCNEVADALEKYVCSILQQDIPNFINLKHKLRDTLKQKLKDFLYAKTFIADIHKAIKDKAYEIKAAYDEAIDSVFAQIRNIVIGVVGKHIANAEAKINKMIGGIGEKMGAGKIDGFAHITGNSIKLLRLDGEFSWKVPEELRYSGYLQIKELDSTGPNGCSPPGQPLTEVTCGANNIPLKWISKGVKANVGGRFTFQRSEGVTRPLGFGGSLEMTEGEIKVGTLLIQKFAAAAMFGIDNPDTDNTNELEAYLAANVGVKFDNYKLGGALFLGRTCTLDPITMVDPDAAAIIGKPPFTGGYCYAEGWFPLFNGGKVFNLSIGAGVGVFYFAEGPTYGGRLMGAVSGELLELLQVTGRMDLIGVKSGDDFRFRGTGKVTGSIGPCDACVEFSKGFRATYLNNSWDLDLVD